MDEQIKAKITNTIIIRLKESPNQIMITTLFTTTTVTSMYNPLFNGKLSEDDIIDETEEGCSKMISKWKEEFEQ